MCIIQAIHCSEKNIQDHESMHDHMSSHEIMSDEDKDKTFNDDGNGDSSSVDDDAERRRGGNFVEGSGDGLIIERCATASSSSLSSSSLSTPLTAVLLRLLDNDSSLL